MGSSGCLGGKLVVAQDVAQSLADLRMQRLCMLLRGIYDIAMGRLGFALQGGWGWDALARATAAAYSWFARCISSSSVVRRAVCVSHAHEKKRVRTSVDQKWDFKGGPAWAYLDFFRFRRRK
jgi:hypothetical protein